MKNQRFQVGQHFGKSPLRTAEESMARVVMAWILRRYKLATGSKLNANRARFDRSTPKRLPLAFNAGTSSEVKIYRRPGNSILIDVTSTKAGGTP